MSYTSTNGMFTYTITNNTNYVIIISILTLKYYLNKPINTVEVYSIIQIVYFMKKFLDRIVNLTKISEGLVSIKRIQKVFDSDEIQTHTNQKYIDDSIGENHNILISFNNATFKH